ncbi:MAG TPA: response regulator [Roseiflexaceae bacterium]|nr:response regulator [Roseiflexaceae bacterium]
MPVNVLVVDDNRLYRDAFCNLLQSCYPHLQLVPAADGSAALSLTRQIAFDLIILDYDLTSISGGDVVRRLRARGAPLPPIIMMSAHPDIAIFSRLLMVTAFLQKPVEERDLRVVFGPLLAEPIRRVSGPTLWRIQQR